MIRRNDIVTPYLEHSLLAARILAALNELQAQRKSAFADSALDQAVTFFGSMLEGSANAKSRQVSERSYDCALAFGEAIEVIDRLDVTPAEKDEPARFVQVLHDKVLNLRNEKVPNPQDVHMLAEFFRLLRDVALLGEAQVYERVSYGE